jgi:hypothetical protein
VQNQKEVRFRLWVDELWKVHKVKDEAKRKENHLKEGGRKRRRRRRNVLDQNDERKSDILAASLASFLDFASDTSYVVVERNLVDVLVEAVFLSSF